MGAAHSFGADAGLAFRPRRAADPLDLERTTSLPDPRRKCLDFRGPSKVRPRHHASGSRATIAPAALVKSPRWFFRPRLPRCRFHHPGCRSGWLPDCRATRTNTGFPAFRRSRAFDAMIAALRMMWVRIADHFDHFAVRSTSPPRYRPNLLAARRKDRGPARRATKDFRCADACASDPRRFGDD